jgi:hypothetical protein
MTLGEQRVRVSFNPSGDNIVDEIKRLTANLINLVNALPDHNDGEVKRIKALAMTEYESAAHWGVKAATARAKPVEVADLIA